MNHTRTKFSQAARLFAYSLIAAALVVAAIPSPSVQAVTVPTCQAVTLVAHRGTNEGVTRNNTIAAFQKAAAAKPDVIELDIHRTLPDASGSGTWVVNHDATLNGYVIAKTPYATLKKSQPDLTTIRDAMKYISTTTANMEVEIKPSTV